MKHHKKNTAFTLVEILTGILIVSIIMIGAFQALASLGVGKIRLIQKTQTQKQALYFSEKLFEMVKYGGTIDYEEYFNRSIVNSALSATNTYGSGHYLARTGYGNFGNGGTIGTTSYGSGFYLCRSRDGVSMGTGGCVTSYNSAGQDHTGSPQRYGQYSYQFRDYNSNMNADGGILGDENSDGNIVGDDDDKYLGEGPEVFSLNANIKELYLINGVKRERIIFRYNVGLDPHRPAGATCTTADNGQSYTGSGCLGTIEYLRLDGRDWGMDHDVGINDPDQTQYDGVIDTWLIDEQFVLGDIVADSNNNSYWQKLFPENIHVTDFKVFPHPNIDTNRAWKVDGQAQNVAEYVRIQLGMMPAWKDRKKIKGNPQEITVSTTISLTDIFTR